MTHLEPAMQDDEIWLGRAFCTLVRGSEKYPSDAIGAVMNFACQAADIVEATSLIRKECLENDLVVMGFEYLMCRAYLDREPSDYEIALIERLSSYPVQFHNVYTFKSDG
jgi:hypothetical protein